MTQTKVIKDAFDDALLNNDTVFIVPHNSPEPDFDALGAALGIGLICRRNKKKSYIIIDVDLSKFGAEERKVVEYLAREFNVINSKLASELITDKSLMVAVDVSKEMLLSDEARKLIPKFNDIFILDHHKIDERTLNAMYSFIDDKLSSTCEEITRLLCAYGIKYTPEEANYLAAGIFLDTNKLAKNASGDTFDVITKLVKKGASVTAVNNMFSADYEEDKKMHRIINNVVFPTQVYAIAVDEDTTKIYNAVDIAKAADYLLKYKIYASFALGYIDEETIAISARSKGEIDVSSIMKVFGGGGNETSAAARIKGESIESVIKKLEILLNPASYLSSSDIQISFDEEGPSLKLSKM